MWEEDSYQEPFYDDVEEFELNQLALDDAHDRFDLRLDEEDDELPETD